MHKPNLFVVGVPKSGTTSMHSYLAQHPDIFMSSYKEPYYFAPEINVTWHTKTLNEYLKLFESVRDFQYYGESTPYYMYSETAAKSIKEFSPKAKIIVLLRNPVDMLYSLHRQLLYCADEDILDFEEALGAQEDRRNGKRIPETCDFPKVLQYFDVAKYSLQLERYLDLFGRENVCVILFDDLSKNTATVYRKALEFLGVDSSFEATFDIKNAAQPLPNLKLRSLMFKYPALKYPIRRLLPDSAIVFLRDKIVGKFTQRQKTKAIAPLLRSRLIQQFKPEIEQLACLINRDLTHWLC